MGAGVCACVRSPRHPRRPRRPPGRTRSFREPLQLDVCGLPLFTIAGACLGTELHLASDNLPFGPVVLGSTAVKRVLPPWIARQEPAVSRRRRVSGCLCCLDGSNACPLAAGRLAIDACGLPAGGLQAALRWPGGGVLGCRGMEAAWVCDCVAGGGLLLSWSAC